MKQNISEYLFANLRKLKQERFLVTILIIILIVLIICRIFAATLIDTFFIDETTRGGLVEAILNPNIKIETEHFNYLFIKTDADASTFGFFIPATIWAFFFSNSILSLRIFACLITISACLLLGRAISYYFDKSRLVWLSASVISLMLPWNFLQGMLFWDATFAPFYIIIGLSAFSYIYNFISRLNLKRPSHLLVFIALPLSLVLAATTYRPIIFLSVGLYIWFLAYLTRRQIYSVRQTITTLIMSIFFAAPAIISILIWPIATERSKEISVTAIDDFPTQVKIVLSNFRKLISPDFLFASGDLNRRHATGVAGMVGLGAIIPILSTVFFTIKKSLSKPEIFLAVLSIFGIFLSLLGSALTVESPPHGLRANCAWIFFVILIFVGFYQLYKHRRHWLAKITLSLAIIVLSLVFIYYLRHFFLYYLPMSSEFFSTPESNINKLFFVKVYLLFR
jgi:hypothetical protein